MILSSRFSKFNETSSFSPGPPIDADPSPLNFIPSEKDPSPAMANFDRFNSPKRGIFAI